MKDIYSHKLKKQLFDNRDEVLELLKKKDKGLWQKINNYAEKFGTSVDIIKKGIIEGNPFALNHFAKDPKKQNFYEKAAAEYISEIVGVEDFKYLKNDQLYRFQGSVIEKKFLRIYNPINSSHLIEDTKSKHNKIATII